ncbi:hypothetical protein ACFXJ8_00855 [Nonomuraea sp. NPDC059194]|uniref:hypothetical protein n=1 Tax=Nonomuraea sp. NPDC059194 TaxID=3346764 RepID=UPI0036B1058C
MGPTLERYVGAIIVQTLCAIWIRRLWAGAVPLAFAACAGDTEDMDACKQSWQTDDKGGLTTEIAALRESLTELKRNLNERVEYEGENKDLFEEHLNKFVAECEKMGEHRNAMGDAAGAPKGLVEAGSYLAVAVSQAMLALAILMKSAWLAGPAGGATGEIAASTVGPQIGRASTMSLKKLMIAGFAISGIYMGVTMLSQQQAAKFQDMKAMPAFDGLGLQYDKNSGRFTPKMPDTKGMPGGMDLPDSFPGVAT